MSSEQEQLRDRILEALFDSETSEPRDLMISEIVRDIGIPFPQVAAQVKILEGQGYIEVNEAINEDHTVTLSAFGLERVLKGKESPESSMQPAKTPSMGEEIKTHHVFLSYSRKDTETMRRVCDDLRAEGLTVWTDETGLVPGTPDWARAIDRAIQDAGCMVVLLSPDAAVSDWVDRETAAAQDWDLHIIPVLIRGDPRDAVPLRLKGHQRIDARPNLGGAIQTLVTSVCNHLGVEGRSEQLAYTSVRQLHEESLEQRSYKASMGTVEVPIDRILQAWDKAIDFFHGVESSLANMLTSNRNLLGWRIAGCIIHFVALGLFLYADLLLGLDSLVMIYPYLRVPAFLDQNTILPLFITSAGPAFILTLLLGDVLGFTNFTPPSILRGLKKPWFMGVILVTLVTTMLFSILMALTRYPELSQLSPSAAEQIGILATISRSLIILPMLITTSFLGWSVLHAPLALFIGVVLIVRLLLQLLRLIVEFLLMIISRIQETIFRQQRLETEKTTPSSLREAVPIWLWIGVVASIAILIGLLTVLGNPELGQIPPTSNLTETLLLAETFSRFASLSVVGNADWEPILQDFAGVQMALVPAGCFMMGSTEDEINYALVELCETHYSGCDREFFEDEAPQHEVCFEEPFWIDVYEVTNAQYGSSGEWSGSDLPREAVDWSDAVAHCEGRGARLPTEAEWEYAVRGPDGLIFPWGNAFDGTLVNYCDTNCEFEWADTNTDDGYANTAPVGSYPGGVSWVGAYDLSGNVWEWVADWYGTYPGEAQVNPSGPISGEDRVLRGGSWGGSLDALRGAYRDRYAPDPVPNRGGFRCARDFDPADLTP